MFNLQQEERLPSRHAALNEHYYGTLDRKFNLYHINRKKLSDITARSITHALLVQVWHRFVIQTIDLIQL
jgi:hypothetical protein